MSEGNLHDEGAREQTGSSKISSHGHRDVSPLEAQCFDPGLAVGEEGFFVAGSALAGDPFGEDFLFDFVRVERVRSAQALRYAVERGLREVGCHGFDVVDVAGL